MLALVTLALSLKPQAPGSRFGANFLTKPSAQQVRAREVLGGTMKTKVFIYYALRRSKIFAWPPSDSRHFATPQC
jgi:hypothetical protein